MLIAGGGLNSAISGSTTAPFNPVEAFKGEYRCIASDLRNANTGQSSGPLELDRPWDSFADDQLGLMDHLGIDKFMVLGFCIWWPLHLEPLEEGTRSCCRRRAGTARRFLAGDAQRPLRDSSMKGWGPELIKRRPEITMEMVEKFLTKMYRTNPDFVFTVTRDFVRKRQTPVLILPDDVPAHPARCRHGGRDARAEGRSEHVPVEGAQGADSPALCGRDVPSSGRRGLASA